MVKTGIAIGIIVIAIIIIGAAYYAVTYKAPQTTVSTTVAAVTTPATNVSTAPSLSTFSKSTVTVTPTKSKSVSVTAPDGVNITAFIPIGTYALINNKTIGTYNFTLATFNINHGSIGSPSGYPNQTPAYGFAFEVNGQITANITFVNSTKSPVHLTTMTHYPTTWTSWAFLGGTFNSSTGTYTGGSYAIQNTWSYNASSGAMTNTQFYKPLMWIFTIGPAPAAPSSTTAPAASNTVKSTTTSGGYGGYGYP